MAGLFEFRASSFLHQALGAVENIVDDVAQVSQLDCLRGEVQGHFKPVRVREAAWVVNGEWPIMRGASLTDLVDWTP